MVAGSTSRGLAPDRRGSTIVARLSSPDPSPRRDRRRPWSRARAAPRKPPTAGRGARRRRARAASIARGLASAGASNPLRAGGGADGWPVVRGSSPAQIPTMRPSSSSPRISHVFPRRRSPTASRCCLPGREARSRRRKDRAAGEHRACEAPPRWPKAATAGTFHGKHRRAGRLGLPLLLPAVRPRPGVGDDHDEPPRRRRSRSPGPVQRAAVVFHGKRQRPVCDSSPVRTGDRAAPYTRRPAQALPAPSRSE